MVNSCWQFRCINSPEHVTNLLMHPPGYQCVTSDRYLITFTITFEYLMSSLIINEVFNLIKGDYTGLSECLLSHDLSSIYNLSDIEEIWHLLKSHITCAMVLFIPKTRLRVRQFPAWFTPQLWHSRKCLRTLQRKINKNPSTSNHQRLSKA